MAGCTECNVCETPGKIEDASETALISSNVRRFQKERYTVWRCPSCHSLHSKEDINLAEYYRLYPFQQQKLDIWARTACNVRLKRLKKEGVLKEDYILDYGCGKGLFVTFLQEKGYANAIGYDPYYPEFSDARLLDRTYKYITTQDVIEHDEEPKLFMNKLANLLSPGGILCVGTANADEIDLSEPENFATPLHQPYHRHLLSESALIHLGESAGLRPGSIYYRWFYDTPFPTINHRFFLSYIKLSGNLIDIIAEPPRIGMVLCSPTLLFYAFFGYFFPPKSEMMIFFHKLES